MSQLDVFSMAQDDILKVYTAIRFRGNENIHMTLAHYGKQRENRILSLIEWCRERSPAVRSLDPWPIVFQKLAFFGPRKDIRVLRPDDDQFAKDFPDLLAQWRTVTLEMMQPNGSVWDFKPHVSHPALPLKTSLLADSVAVMTGKNVLWEVHFEGILK